MRIEVEPSEFNKVLRKAGLNDSQITSISTEFAKNANVLDDENFLDLLIELNKDIYTIISVFEQFGVSRETVISMVEERQKRKLGGVVDIYTLEVEG